MTFQDIMRSPSPEPGSIEAALKNDVDAGDFSNIRDPVRTLDEQKELFNQRLDYFLSNISDTSGAQQILKSFYQERYGKRIDVTDVDILRGKISSLDDIIENNLLPVITKQEIRESFDVYSAPISDNMESSSRPHLTPGWVLDNNEPHVMDSTGGTMGEPWKRLLTRNDWAITIGRLIETFYEISDINDIERTKANVAYIVPANDKVGERKLNEVSDYLGFDGEFYDYNRISRGGKEGISEEEEVISHVEDAEYGLLLAPVNSVMSGKLGVEFRRGNVDLDVIINAGVPIPKHHRETLESSGYDVEDFFGETEYPQNGGLKKEVNGEVGFDLPLTSQVNLVYNPETEKLDYEGEGLFGYLPFGLEGQIIPGIYLSGIRGHIKRTGGNQLLQDVERVVDREGGCFDV